MECQDESDDSFRSRLRDFCVILPAGAGAGGENGCL